MRIYYWQVVIGFVDKNDRSLAFFELFLLGHLKSVYSYSRPFVGLYSNHFLLSTIMAFSLLTRVLTSLGESSFLFFTSS